MRVLFLVVTAAVFGSGNSVVVAGDEAVQVQTLRVPDGGIQPRIASDQKGVVHLVYLKGDPGASDIFYTQLKPGETEFLPSVRVNSQPGSAIAMGTIRGAQIALGRDGLIHIAWNGSGKASPKNTFGTTPMLYTRSIDGGRSFEPQRNVMLRTSSLDGGGSVAADANGNVYVAWHASDENSEVGEAHRKMWVTSSRDDGRTFSPEIAAIGNEIGACGCCGIAALSDKGGKVFLLYRAARNGEGRDMYLLRSGDKGHLFRESMLHPWKLTACPMSSACLINGKTSVFAAWETNTQVFFTKIDPDSGGGSKIASPPGGRGRKHPTIAENSRGQVLLAWAEGTGWQRGGTLAWRVFDKDFTATNVEGKVHEGIPTWGFPAAISRPDGSFVIIH